MKFKTFFFSAGLIVVAGMFSFCNKENETVPSSPMANEIPSDGFVDPNLGTDATDRGVIPQIDCSQKTVHYTQLASTGSHNTAFQGNWVQELDRIANNCRPQSACGSYTGAGQTYFCCQTELLISEILLTGGYGQNWPNVTPVEQNYIIDYTLNYARTHLQPCAEGVTPVILAVDYQRDPFITSGLTINVKYACCAAGGGNPN